MKHEVFLKVILYSLEALTIITSLFILLYIIIYLIVFKINSGFEASNRVEKHIEYTISLNNTTNPNFMIKLVINSISDTPLFIHNSNDKEVYNDSFVSKPLNNFKHAQT